MGRIPPCHGGEASSSLAGAANILHIGVRMKTPKEVAEELCSVQPMSNNCFKEVLEALKAREERVRVERAGIRDAANRPKM